MGKRNWLFASTEVGALRVGIIQSLLVTCKLHAVDPYTYLVDVLQRISSHPEPRVIELTPRVWKSLFAHDPLPSATITTSRLHTEPDQPITPHIARVLPRRLELRIASTMKLEI